MENQKELLPSIHQEDLFFNAFQYAAIGMALVATDGKWLKVNKALCKIIGYEESELLQKTFQDITHPDDLEEDLDNVNKMLAGEISTYQMEKRYFHKDGSVIYVLLSVSLVWDKNDKPLFFISQIQNITDKKLLEEELINQAQLDSLTGVNNRRRYYQLAEEELKRSNRYAEPAVILMIDIDHFKNINDTYGHGTGDTVLQKMAEACVSGFRSFDIFGRVGGEEFSAFLIKANAKIGRKVVERVRRSLESLIIATDKGIVRFTVSVGGVAFTGNWHTLEYRLKQADEALYQAKASGRNKAIIIDDTSPVDGDNSHMLRLNWKKEYLSGNRTIDEQHQNLFSLSNLLLNSMITNNEGDASLMLLDTLNRETRNHFDTEERILEDIGYQAVGEHQSLHEEMLQIAAEMTSKYQKGTIGINEVFHFIVMDLVKGHMLAEDTKFYNHIRKHL